MPSPFPGMDPFIEDQVWRDFHTELITAIRAFLAPRLVPHYIMRVEEHVYLEYAPDERKRLRSPDVFVVEREVAPLPTAAAAGTATLVAIEAVTLTLPEPRYRREAYLTIRDRESLQLITAIELLSPTNKEASGPGQRQYLEKRDEMLQSTAHLIELDLLRGGERLPTVEPLPAGDYFAFVSRAPQRPKVTVYAWPLRHPLPGIPVPLAGEDPDVDLDLQAAFTTAYDRALYSFVLDYRHAVHPPLSESDAVWTREILAAAAPSAARRE